MDENGKKICSSYPREQDINLLSVIGVLVATVSFTAGLTVPGGFNSSDYGPAGQGMATLADQWMFQVFIICDTIAMSFSIIGSFILLWSQICDIIAGTLAYALFFLLEALFALSLAFIFAVCLVVSKIHWLWYLVLLLGLFLLGSLLTLHFFWLFPYWNPHPVCRCISYYAIPYMLRFTESYSKDKQEESQSANKSPSYLALCVRCMNEMTERSGLLRG
uniref:PGG domain-containing protein n=1 Tax=Fagus sylvatica TaxID=28930 RepID=A0A2N9ERI1_FAGSY